MPLLGVGCGLIASVQDGRLLQVSGEPDHPVNRGATCRKLLALPDAVHAPDRARVGTSSGRITRASGIEPPTGGFCFVAHRALGNRLLLCPRGGRRGSRLANAVAEPEDTPVVDFEYTRSQGAHGHHRVGVFDALVGSQREIWVGSDGSGLIRESSGPISFFTEAGRAKWQAAGSPALEHGPSVDLFAPGCLGGSRVWRARLERDPDGLTAALTRQTRALHDVQALLGEAVADAAFCESVYAVARELPGVEVLPELDDQLGRSGRGLARVENEQRIELIFAADCSELLGYQWFLAEPRPYAPAGALHSWSAFLERTLVDDLPEDIPPIPNLPCEPPSSARGFPIRPGFSVITGDVTDPVAQLARLRDQGVITDAEYDTARAHQNAS